jgi:hypothetical protein
MFGDVGGPFLIRTVDGEVSIQQVAGRYRVRQVPSSLFSRWFTLTLQFAHDLVNKFGVHDQATFDPQGRTDAITPLGVPRVGIHLSDSVGEQHPTNVAIARLTILTVEGRAASNTGRPAGRPRRVPVVYDSFCNGLSPFGSTTCVPLNSARQRRWCSQKETSDRVKDS